MKIGILFGGPAKEREISFAGGKTVYQHLNRDLFEPVLVFVDSSGQFILVNPQIFSQKEIRDFYPPKEAHSSEFRIYDDSLGDISLQEKTDMANSVGHKIKPQEFSLYFEFALIAMHGPSCEDGSIQGLLEWYGIPYSGPGLLGSAIGIDKGKQNNWLKKSVEMNKKYLILSRASVDPQNLASIFENCKNELGLPLVIKSPHQGSSIGLSILKEDSLEGFSSAIKQCFFIQEIKKNEWENKSKTEKIGFIQSIVNLDEGIGMPVVMNQEIVYHPNQLWEKIEEYFSSKDADLMLESVHSEDAVLLEEFVRGKEFSCGVFQEPDGQKSIALPPTGIFPAAEKDQVFDFKAKYQSTETRKEIPIRTSMENLHAIQSKVSKAFDDLGMGVCARIDGFLKEDGTIWLHDPNTIPGMSPASLIFKQSAEIGLNITDTITYFIRQSLRERLKNGKNYVIFDSVLKNLDKKIQENLNTRKNAEIKVFYLDANSHNKEEEFEEILTEIQKIKIESKFDFQVKLINHPVQNEIILDSSHLIKSNWKELDESIQEGVHPLIQENRIKAQKITQFYTNSHGSN